MPTSLATARAIGPARLEAQARQLFAKAQDATGTDRYAAAFQAWSKVYRLVISLRLSQD